MRVNMIRVFLNSEMQESFVRLWQKSFDWNDNLSGRLLVSQIPFFSLHVMPPSFQLTSRDMRRGICVIIKSINMVSQSVQSNITIFPVNFLPNRTFLTTHVIFLTIHIISCCCIEPHVSYTQTSCSWNQLINRRSGSFLKHQKVNASLGEHFLLMRLSKIWTQHEIVLLTAREVLGY